MKFRSPLLCASACLLLACGNTGAPELDYGPLLGNVSQQVILPEHRQFVTQAQALVDSVQMLSDSPDEVSLQAAQAAWREARKAYRTLDALHVGPGYTLHITEAIDVSPIDLDGIEALVTGSGAVDDQAVRNAGAKKKGFLGLEYLLFAEPSSKLPAPALADDDWAVRRRLLAISMADEIAKLARDLDAAWEGDDGAAAQLEQAGKGGTKYATQRAAVDDLIGGTGYALELIVGVRLALPLGRHNGGTPDPSLDPTLRSDSAVADMQASLAGVFALYSGDGLSAVIRGKSSALDQRVLDQFTAGEAKLNALPAPFETAVVDDTALVQEAYDSTQALKKTWNTDVASALGATARTGENDGD